MVDDRNRQERRRRQNREAQQRYRKRMRLSPANGADNLSANTSASAGEVTESLANLEQELFEVDLSKCLGPNDASVNLTALGLEVTWRNGFGSFKPARTEHALESAVLDANQANLDGNFSFPSFQVVSSTAFPDFSTQELEVCEVANASTSTLSPNTRRNAQEASPVVASNIGDEHSSRSLLPITEVQTLAHSPIGYLRDGKLCNSHANKPHQCSEKSKDSRPTSSIEQRTDSRTRSRSPCSSPLDEPRALNAPQLISGVWKLYKFGVEFGLLEKNKIVETYLANMYTKFNTIVTTTSPRGDET